MMVLNKELLMENTTLVMAHKKKSEKLLVVTLRNQEISLISHLQIKKLFLLVKYQEQTNLTMVVRMSRILVQEHLIPLPI
jgi:hypothetical protein